MDYKKLHEETLAALQKMVFDGKITEETARRICSDFIKESEDEKIRKSIIELVRQSSEILDKQNQNNMIAWLEKQGEQKPDDKVEPKFKNGQWIVWQDKCYKVNYDGCGYELIDPNGLITSLKYSTIDENAHLWDITKDAKDGDVLTDDTSIIIFRKIGNDVWNDVVDYYVGYNHDSGKIIIQSGKSFYGTINTVTFKPATKEQLDILLQKMREAGYELDAKRKGVKKIESKPACSEENSCYYNDICEILINLINSPTSNVNKDAVQKDLDWLMENWLKSIKERHTWKPNEEQMEMDLKKEIDRYCEPIRAWQIQEAPIYMPSEPCPPLLQTWPA